MVRISVHENDPAIGVIVEPALTNSPFAHAKLRVPLISSDPLYAIETVEPEAYPDPVSVTVVVEEVTGTALGLAVKTVLDEENITIVTPATAVNPVPARPLAFTNP